jgi:murein DD-endopeptidase MepM/ murein hydrolase activator NlpD
VQRFQKWAELEVDGVAGAATLRALTAPPPAIPLPLTWPLTAPVLGDRFGPRGDRWHAGVDFPAPLGTPVYAARSGRVTWAGWHNGGFGLAVTVSHGRGERTIYAHLSRIDVRVGVWVGQGVRVGLVGASGHATGPHLHFEVRVRGAAVDPLRAVP